MWIAISNAIGQRVGTGGGPGPGPGYTPPLDTYTGATVAYSVRKLSSSYSGSCIEAYRVSDGATQDIGFDSDGLIDTAAIATFGGSSEVTVKTWYDQSGQSNHATQVTAGSQPSIYDGSAVITENGKPALDLDGSNDFFDLPSTQWTNGQMMTSLVLKRDVSHNGTYFQTATSILRMFYESAIHRFVHYGTTPIVTGSTTPPPLSQTLITARMGASSVDLYEDGTSVANTSSYTGSMSTASDTAFIGQKNNNKNRVNGKLQEFMHWGSDQTSNRTGVESNINGYFQIANLPAQTGFLADYPGAAAAYSVRSLSNNATKCMRVRRTVAPFDEQDIGFDSNGDLDTAAIAAFGGSDPLTVSVWYDQSGSGNNATQVTASSQPTIYDGAAVITENGKPALDFDGTNDFLVSPTITVTDGELMQSAVFVADVNSGGIASCDSSPVRVAQTMNLNSATTMRLLTFNSSGGVDAIVTSTANAVGTQTLGTSQILSGQGEMFVDGSGTLSGTFNVRTDATTIQIGKGSAFGAFFDGRTQEVLHWPSQQTNRTAIESDINTYYSIY